MFHLYCTDNGYLYEDGRADGYFFMNNHTRTDLHTCRLVKFKDTKHAYHYLHDHRDNAIITRTLKTV